MCLHACADGSTRERNGTRGGPLGRLTGRCEGINTKGAARSMRTHSCDRVVEGGVMYTAVGSEGDGTHAGG